jgi:uncharacterized protein YkwD
MTKTGSLAAIFLAALLSAVCAASASAALTFRVVDDQGRPQVAYVYMGTSGGNESYLRMTDANGVYVEEFPTPGTYHVVRTTDTYAECQAPEGPQGVAYTYEGEYGGTASATVTLPTLARPAVDPGINPDEQQFIDIWQAHRASLGLAPLQLNRALTATADWSSAYLRSIYSTWLSGMNSGLSPHCFLSNPIARTHATQYVGRRVGENITFAPSAAEAFARFLNSDTHRALLETRNGYVAGVAVNGNAWLVLVGMEPCAADCGPPDQSTASTLTPPQEETPAPHPEEKGGPPATKKRGTVQRVRGVPKFLRNLKPGKSARGRAVRVSVKASKLSNRRALLIVRRGAATGPTYLSVHGPRFSRTWKLTGVKNSVTFTLPAHRGRRYVVKAYLDGDSGWGDSRARDQVVRVR